MKVLFVAPASELTTQILSAFRDSGHEVVYLNERANYLVPRFLNTSKILWRIVRHVPLLKKWSNRRFNFALSEMIRQGRPDCLFVAKGMNISPSTLVFARQQGVLTVNWFLDNVYHPRYRSWFKEHFEDYNIMISFDSSVAEQFHSKSTRLAYVPVAIDDAQYRNVRVTAADHVRYDCDLCFIGAAYPERIELLQRFTHLNLRIFGWSGWQHTPLAPWYHGPLTPEQAAKVYQCATISLNTNTEPATKGVNLKTFEIPAAGGFQLSDYREDVASLFDVDSEIAIFRNPEELRLKIDYYLNHPHERKVMALAAKDRTMREHTIKRRVDSILAIIEQEKSPSR